MSDDSVPRRQFLAALGSTGATALAGCSGNDTDTETYNTDTPTGTNSNDYVTDTPTPGSDYQPDPKIGLLGDSLVETDDGVYVATGETLEANCEVNLKELAEHHLNVQSPEGSSEAQCGETYKFQDPGEYLFVLTAESEGGNTAEDSYSIKAMVPPEIQGIEAPEELTVKQPNEVQYQVAGTDLQTNHQVEMPNSQSEQYEGNTFTVTPQEHGEVVINSTAENTVGQDQLQKVLEANYQINLEKNQEKRKEAIGLVPHPGEFVWYDTGLMSKLEPEKAEETGIKPNQEWYLYNNGASPGFEGAIRFEIRKFDNIKEDENLDDFFELEKLTSPYSDEVPEEIGKYRGKKIWYKNPQVRWIVDSGNDYIFQVLDRGLEDFVDVIEDDPEMHTWLDEPLHSEGVLDNDIVIAENYFEDLFTERTDDDHTQKEGEIRAQILDREEFTFTELFFNYDFRGTIKKLDEVNGIPTSVIVEDYNVPDNLGFFNP